MTTKEGPWTVMTYYMKSETWINGGGRRDANPTPSIKSTTYSNQMLKGVAFLHDHGITHGDLKPANILVDGDGWGIKICYIYRPNPNPGCRQVVVVQGPPCGCGAAADVWSVGCIMAEMLVDHVLFPGYSEADQLDCIQRAVRPPSNFLSQRIAAAKYSPAAEALTHSHAGLDLLQRLLAYEIDDRITARDALHHAWFRQ